MEVVDGFLMDCFVGPVWGYSVASVGTQRARRLQCMVANRIKGKGVGRFCLFALSITSVESVSGMGIAIAIGMDRGMMGSRHEEMEYKRTRGQARLGSDGCQLQRH